MAKVMQALRDEHKTEFLGRVAAVVCSNRSVEFHYSWPGCHCPVCRAAIAAYKPLLQPSSVERIRVSALHHTDIPACIARKCRVTFKRAYAVKPRCWGCGGVLTAAGHGVITGAPS